MWSSSSSVGCCYCVCILIREYREAHVRAHISHSPFSHTNTYTYTMSIGVPIKLLHEAEKHIVTVELKTGDIYRGQLVEAEDNMNCQLANITYTARDGRRSTLEYAFIRGSKIRWMILPDMLKNAPMFKRVDPKSRGLGRGKIIAMKSKMRSGGGAGGGGGGRDWQNRGNR